MSDVHWERYPLLAAHPLARSWLAIQFNLQLSPNTIDAYGRGIEDYLHFCARETILPETTTRQNIAQYVRDLAERPRVNRMSGLNSGTGLANATMQQRLTAVRLFFDFLVEEGICVSNPVGRGRYTPGKGFSGARDRGLIPRYQKLPWIPNDLQWQAILEAAKTESLRNRVMFALAYDAALRREEVVSLEISDIDPSHRLLRIRAETTKNRRERVVPYSIVTSKLYSAYLHQRRGLSRARGPLFLSESRRNRATPVSIWTWTKVVEQIADRARVHQFTTHSLRHLCLTDLAHANWDIHEIATFAGHRSIQTTLQYIHLSGRDLASKLERGMASIHTWRLNLLGEAFT